MSWKKERHEDPIETVFRSNAIEYPGIAKDIQTVFARLAELQEAEKTTFEADIFFLVNSSDGHIRISWYDPKNEDWIAGRWAFHLELRDLLHLCDSHEEGAQHFVRQVHFALCDTFQEYYVCDDIPESDDWIEYSKYRLFVLYEGSSEVQEIIV